MKLLIGPTVPVPAPAFLVEALDKVEVTESSAERSGFQLTFRAGRGGGLLSEYPLLANPLLKPGMRVILAVNLGAVAQVLIDGLVTHQQLSPGDGPGQGTLAVTGDDLTAVMDREEKVAEHPALPEATIAQRILAGYALYGVIPVVVPSAVFEVPSPTERIPVQRGTDLAYLKDLAGRFGYEFHLSPGPVPGTSTAYWGPPRRIGVPQPALSVNLGSETNVVRADFKNDAAQAAAVAGQVQDPRSNRAVPVRSFPSLRVPLAASPMLAESSVARRLLLPAGGGKSAVQASAEAQGTSEAASDVVQVDGELDTGRYGGVLRARSLVGLRGAGLSYDGLYYVKEVTHSIARGSYAQSFSLVREGTGTTVPAVRP